MQSYELREKLVADKFTAPATTSSRPKAAGTTSTAPSSGTAATTSATCRKSPTPPARSTSPAGSTSAAGTSSTGAIHKASLREPLEGKKGDYFNSGDVMEGMPVPTIITNMPRRGICIYQSHDDNLDHWIPLPENPVIPLDPAPEGDRSMASSQLPECVIFDPSGWKEGDVYYALIGNKNHRPGYEGDSTSLFKSTNLSDWQYLGPFYKSDRKWTEEIEDCACSNFFPFGDKHMLLMHTHQPYGRAQYYIGRYQDQQFYPEVYGQLSHLGSLVAGPETLVDDNRGRRLFWGWIREARGDWANHGWNGVMSLPWHFTPAADNTLRIDPVAELRALRYDERRHPDLTLSQGEERTLQGFQSDCAEIKLTIHPNQATRFGLKLLCSPDGQEETVVTYDTQRQHFIVDFDRLSLDPSSPTAATPATPPPASANKTSPSPSRPTNPSTSTSSSIAPSSKSSSTQKSASSSASTPPAPTAPSSNSSPTTTPSTSPTSPNTKWTPPTPGNPQTTPIRHCVGAFRRSQTGLFRSCRLFP